VSRLPQKIKPGDEPLDVQELRDWRAALPRGGSLDQDRLGNALRAHSLEGEERAKREIDWSECPLYVMYTPGRRPGLWRNALTVMREQRAQRLGLSLEAYVASLSTGARTRRHMCGKRSPLAQSAAAAKDPE
jgi:hypothetical protein